MYDHGTGECISGQALELRVLVVAGGVMDQDVPGGQHRVLAGQVQRASQPVLPAGKLDELRRMEGDVAPSTIWNGNF